MVKRYFSVAEADRLVPRLEAAFGRVLRLRAEVHTVADELEFLGEPLSDDNFDAPMPSGTPAALISARGRAQALVETLTEEIASIEALGVEVKDLDSGLCDFVSRRDGREVFLCWRLGEKRITHWHELSAGFSGRKPLDGASAGLVH